MLFFSFSYRCKIIIKVVSNTTGIGYSITIIGTLETTISREIGDLIPFRMFLILFLISILNYLNIIHLKIFIITDLFPSFQNFFYLE